MRLTYIDTLILQLGHILHSVHAWQRTYKLRVMVFVEYQYEVAEEQARLRALLDKLRIEAEVKVFCLASGELETYELIIHGECNDIDWEIIVNDALRDEEWWDDLQMYRGRAEDMTTVDGVDHLTHIFESTSGRPGIYNPHEVHRRPSVINVSDIPKRPAIGMLSRLGVNVSIHTQHLKDEVLDDEGSDDDSDSGTFQWCDKVPRDDEEEEEEIDPRDPVVQPLLASPTRNRHQASRSKDSTDRGRSKRETKIEKTSPTTFYGTMPSSQTLGHDGRAHQPSAMLEHLEEFPTLASLDALRVEATSESRSASQSRRSTQETIRPVRDGTLTPRPALSRQSSTVRFSSRPVPETRITSEAEGSKIGFAPDPAPEATGTDQAQFPRQRSFGKFSSRPMPLTRLASGAEDPRTIAFAEQPTYHSSSASHSRHHSRQGSQFSTFGQSETSLSMSEILQHYRLDTQVGGDGAEGHSMHSTEEVELSFNELPSRAQHLILNELMRQHSKDTAVLLTTLPIPSEGTSLEESSSVQYLSDVEVLCNQLPPTLMVLSNNMTVTVSL